ncbi:MAG TPA: hypothetical protein VE968_05930 [Sphingomicrobium sp.]|nr:hypothetical protein [Sphingomicrobium sp.]
MILLLPAAVAIAAPPSKAAATVESTATIRVLRAVTLKLDGSANPELPPPRSTVIKRENGSFDRAKVFDFQ